MAITYLATGGRLGEQLFDEILGETIERRTRRMMGAPGPFGEFLAYQFERGEDDSAWLNFLQREALAVGEGPMRHEPERLPVLERQVDEVRHRQADHLIPADLDPGSVRLMAFALSSYPRLLPQITRMTDDDAPVSDSNRPGTARAQRQLARPWRKYAARSAHACCDPSI